MKIQTREEDRYCFYCGGVVSENSKGDHFPIPKRLGGDNIVPCCQSCHNMKDRVSLMNWPTPWISNTLGDYEIITSYVKLSRETKILLAKVITLLMDLRSKRRKKERK